MIMIGTFFIWTLSIIILKLNDNDKSLYWASILAFFGGFGPIPVFMGDVIIPYFSANHAVSISLLYTIESVISSMAHYLVPYSALMYGLTYSKLLSDKKLKFAYFLFLIPVIFSFIYFPFVCNDLKPKNELKLYFRQIAIWTLPYMSGCNILIIYSYLKEKGANIKKQHFVNMLVVVPFITYCIFSNIIFRAFGIENLWRGFLVLLPIQFLMFSILAIRHGVLGVRIKFEKHKHTISNIFDHISDLVLIIDENLQVVEINKSFETVFNKFTEKEDCLTFFEKSPLRTYKDFLYENIKRKLTTQKELSLLISDKNIYFDVEIKPIIYKNQYFGTSILFKDVTIYKENLELLKNLTDKEKYYTFFHLIGGIAHNLKTPLMASLGGVEILNKSTGRLIELNKISSGRFDNKEFESIINKKIKWEKILKDNIEHISETIHFIQNHSITDDFITIESLVKKIKIFMGFELSKNSCLLNSNINVPLDYKLESSIVQVLNNIILNAVQSYEGLTQDHNVIELNINKSSELLVFEVKDFGRKVPNEVRKEIFSKMVTTKGNGGSGLGLYISQIIIKAKFNGIIYFKSTDNETSFFIELPYGYGNDS